MPKNKRYFVRSVRWGRMRGSLLPVLLVFALAVPGRAAKTVRVVDVLKVRADAPASSAIVTLTPPSHPEVVSCDVLVAGASTGGVAAALAVAREGHSVCLTEETRWIGGQRACWSLAAICPVRFWMRRHSAAR